jgi:hypothetical protein
MKIDELRKRIYENHVKKQRKSKIEKYKAKNKIKEK